MDWEKESQTEKPSGKKKEKYIMLERVWMCIVGCTVGTFWGFIIGKILKMIAAN